MPVAGSVRSDISAEDWLVTARHEAAHIVCALELDVGFIDVQIRERAGQIVGELNDPVGDPIRVAICALAGLAGEHIDVGELILSGAVDDDGAQPQRQQLVFMLPHLPFARGVGTGSVGWIPVVPDLPGL